MIIIFGWSKDAREAGPAPACYCYRCQKQRAWEYWKETEWVAFFMIKTIPYLSKSHIVCAACRQGIALDVARTTQLRDERYWPQLVDWLEGAQLANKSELQKNFLRAQRAGRG